MKNRYAQKLKKRHSACLLKTALFLSVFSLFSSQQAQAQLTGWKYRDGITVHENAGVQNINYQVLLNINTAAMVSAGKMDATGKDIRFSKDCSGSVLLNYFIETGMNTANTQVWVELDTLKANGNYLLYLWYGNSAATAASNFNNTFPLSTQLVVPAGSVALSGTNNYSWFEIQAGASVVIGPNSPFVINARKIKITGVLNGDGAGYLGGQASQNGNGPGGGKAGAVLTPVNTSGGGGAYGGNGGRGTVAAGTNGDGGTAYGNTTSIDMGSGGGGPVGGGAGATDGNGGAGITLNARAVEITGTVSANGNIGTSITGAGYGGGGGAGGGVLMHAYNALLTGNINAKGANGGDGAGGGGGGGGGRINLYSEIPFAPGTYDVGAGAPGITGNTANAAGLGGSAGVIATGTFVAMEPTYTLVPHVQLNSSSFPVCQGSSATFTASTSSSTYMFYVDTALKQNTGSNTFSSNTLANNDTVMVLVPDANGCKDTSNRIVVTVNPKPTVTLSPATTICQGQSTVLTASGGTTYNWSPSSSLSSPSGATVTASPTASTTYTVLVTDNNSCQNSDTVTVTVNGCTNIAKSRSSIMVNLYPNPAQSTLTVTADLENASDLKVILCDMLGNTVRSIDQQKISGPYKKEIDISDLADGLYFISVKAGEHLVTRKFVKKDIF